MNCCVNCKNIMKGTEQDEGSVRKGAGSCKLFLTTLRTLYWTKRVAGSSSSFVRLSVPFASIIVSCNGKKQNTHSHTHTQKKKCSRKKLFQSNSRLSQKTKSRTLLFHHNGGHESLHRQVQVWKDDNSGSCALLSSDMR